MCEAKVAAMVAKRVKNLPANMVEFWSSGEGRCLSRGEFENELTAPTRKEIKARFGIVRQRASGFARVQIPDHSS